MDEVLQSISSRSRLKKPKEIKRRTFSAFIRMSKHGFSKKELVSILEIIEGAQDCDDPQRLKALLLKAKDLVEADYATSGVVKALSEGEPRIVEIVNGNYPRQWLEFYMSEGIYRIDPLLKYHGMFSMSQLWSDIFKVCNEASERQAIGYASEFGLRHGISGSIYVPETDCMGVFVFAGEKNSFKERHKKITDILALHLNHALMRSVNPPQPVLGRGYL